MEYGCVGPVVFIEWTVGFVPHNLGVFIEAAPYLWHRYDFNAFKEFEQPLGIPESIWDDNIKMKLREL
jgi:hypothetical protein